MTTATVLIQRAYREGNLIPVGKDPTDTEVAEAVLVLNSYVRGLYGQECGTALSEWQAPYGQRTAPIHSDYPQIPLDTIFLDPLFQEFDSANSVPQSVWAYPPNNSRILLGDGAGTIYFPEHPHDGARMAIVNGTLPALQTVVLDGNSRLIDEELTVTVTGVVEAQEWLYRADLGNWQTVEDMGADDESPFPVEFDDLLIIGTSMRLAPRYGKALSQESVAQLAKVTKFFKARYTQPTKTIGNATDFPPGLQSYRRGQWGFRW